MLTGLGFGGYRGFVMLDLATFWSMGFGGMFSHIYVSSFWRSSVNHEPPQSPQSLADRQPLHSCKRAETPTLSIRSKLALLRKAAGL